MSCAPLILDRFAETQLAVITQGAGNSAPTVTARVKVPSSKLHVHIAIFARKNDNTLFTAGNSATWDLVPMWPAPSVGGGPPVPLKSVFDGAQTLFDGYEIPGSAVQVWQITAVLSVSALTPGSGRYILGVTFEPLDPAMGPEERDEWFGLCGVEVDNNGTIVVNGTGV